MSSGIFYDINIWEEIRSILSWRAALLVESINQEIPKDTSLAEFQGKHPVPLQLRQITEQRANAWVQRLYDACCDAYKSRGKTPSADFDRAIWFYRVEPFIMGETDSQIQSIGKSKTRFVVRMTWRGLGLISGYGGSHIFRPAVVRL